MNCDFGSIRRKNRVSQPSCRRKTFSSSSNLSCISCNSASVGRKTVYVTLPKDFGCDVNLEGKIVHMIKGSPAHAVGVLQIGDYIRIVDEHQHNNGCDDEDDINVVKLQVIYGVLQVELRPNYPLVIEIGNRSQTSLGIALADSSENKIEISSIQPGSLADRCGFLCAGDILTSIYISPDETIPCSPFYNSYQIAQTLRQLTSKLSTIKLTIIPCSHSSHPSQTSIVHCHNLPEDIDVHSGGSDSTLTLGESDSSNNSGGGFGYHPNNGGGVVGSTSFTGKTFRNVHSPSSLQLLLPKRQIEKVDEDEELLEEEDNLNNFCGGGSGGNTDNWRGFDNGGGRSINDGCCILSLCLWKDPLYEDWGFSLGDDGSEETDVDGDTDSFENVEEHSSSSNNIRLSLLRKKTNKQQELGKSSHHHEGGAAIVANIRRGGPAYVAGLRPSDRIVEINGQNVSKLESTMLVPILASLEDALNLIILRDPNSNLDE